MLRARKFFRKIDIEKKVGKKKIKTNSDENQIDAGIVLAS